MKFTEARLEQAVVDLLEQKGYPHSTGESIVRDQGDVLIKDDLGRYLKLCSGQLFPDTSLRVFS